MVQIVVVFLVVTLFFSETVVFLYLRLAVRAMFPFARRSKFELTQSRRFLDYFTGAKQMFDIHPIVDF